MQCADNKVEALCEALQATVQQWRGRFPSPLPLELYTSSNFIGLFVGDQSAEVLKQFAADFAAEATKKAGRNRRHQVQGGRDLEHIWTLNCMSFSLSVFTIFLQHCILQSVSTS